VPATVASLIDRALAAHAALADVGEAVADETQYIADLGVVWRARLRAVGSERGNDTAAADVELAVDTVIAETARITDPHRAIDWLSTLPQVVLVALDEPA
jgi:hypothetical protein